MRTRVRARARGGESVPGDSILEVPVLVLIDVTRARPTVVVILVGDFLARVSTHAPDRNMFSTAFASSTPRVAPAASLSASRRGSSAIAPLAVKCRGRTRVSSRRRHLVRTRAADLPDDPFKVRARPTATSDPTPRSQSPSSPLDRPAHVSPSVFSASSSPSSTHRFLPGQMAKKVQGSIPVVSLVSKLLSPEGASAQTPFPTTSTAARSSTPPAAPISARPL